MQIGAALATTLFDQVGPAGAVFLRTAAGAAILLALAGGRLPRLRGTTLREVALFGVALAGVNWSFYEAIERLPLGVVATIQFTGPLALAVLGSRRRSDLLWVLLAGAGIVLLSGGLSGRVDAVGALLALLASAFWALYIVQSARVGRRLEGLGGLLAAMAISALLLAPLGIAAGGAELLSAPVLLVGLAIGLLSSAIPYALEHEALRHLSHATFGVLMSLEPAVAALVGAVALAQGLSALEALAIALVVAAGAGALRSAAAPAPTQGPETSGGT